MGAATTVLGSAFLTVRFSALLPSTTTIPFYTFCVLLFLLGTW